MNPRRPMSTRRAALLGAVGALSAAALVVATVWALRAGAPTSNRSTDGVASGAPMAGMDMSGMGTGGDVSLTAEEIRSLGVTFESAELRALDDVVRAVGVIVPNEARVAAVTARIDGYVERLHADFTGRSVRRGEPLAEIFSPELLSLQEELLLASRVEAASPDRITPSPGLVAPARERLLRLGVTEAQIDRMLADGRIARTLTIDSPMEGVVLEKNVLSGEAIEAGQSLFVIADLRTLWMEVEVRAGDAALVGAGDPVTMEIGSLPGLLVTGRIDYVYPGLEVGARTLRARVPLDNSGGRLRPGMYADVRIRVAGRTALAVPASAVVDTGERQFVFVDMGRGRLAPQDVETGRTSGDLTEVVFGVEPGQRVVTSAQFLLDSESNLAEVMRSMIGQMNTSDMGDRDMAGMGGMDMPGQGR